jgi:hypothetical protein
MNQNKFRIYAKKLLLTYPQCNLEPTNVLKLLQDKLDIKDYLIAQELHQDKGLHIHAFLELQNTKDIKNPTFLDLHEETNIFHGNYQVAKFKPKIINYLLKDTKNFIASNDILLHIKNHSFKKNSNINEDILNLAKNGDLTQALQLYEKTYPLSYLRSPKAIENSFKFIHLKQLGFKTKYQLKDFIIPNDLKKLLDSTDLKNPTQTIQIEGKTGTGKTAFLIAYLEQFNIPFFRVCNLDGLRFYKGEPIIIYDDFDWNNPSIQRENAIHLLDVNSSATISIKHSSVHIKEGPKFILTNKPLKDYSTYINNHIFSLDEIQRRVFSYSLKESLIKDSNTSLEDSKNPNN